MSSSQSLNDKLRSGVSQANMSLFSPISSVETESRGGWVEYGVDNMYPQYLIELYYNSPVHNALTSSIAFMIQGKGTSNPLLDYCIDKIAFDLKLQGGFFAEIIWNLDYTEPAKINHLPFENCRLSYDKESENITGIWYSLDWSNTRTKKGKPEFIPLYDKERAMEEPRQVVYSFIPTAGSMYYGKPDYYGALTYIELSRNIGLYHVNNILNGLFPSFIVAFNNGVPSEEQRDSIVRELERSVSGAQNAGKFWVTWNDDPNRKTDITSFPISDADKQYEYLDEGSTRQIMVGHRVTSPLLFGIRDSGGLGSNKDEMIVAFDIFMNQVIKPFQKIISEVFVPIIGSVEFVQNSYFETTDTSAPSDVAPAPSPTDTTSTTPVDPTAETKVSDVTYNGAQIASAIDIVAKVKEGILTKEQAIVFLVQFLQLDVNVAESMFSTDGSNAVAQLSAVKKKVDKVCCNAEVTDETLHKYVDELETRAEFIDEEEWELISDERAGSKEEEESFIQEFFASRMPTKSNAKGNEKSKWGDSGLYKLRFAYNTELTYGDNGELVSRPFCKRMVDLSVKGAVFRWEDLSIDSPDSMSSAGINGAFAPSGSTTYDIFTYKGGVYCHHYFRRLIFFRKRVKGKFLPNNGLKNDEQVSQGTFPFLPKKGKEGTPTIDMKNRGSLKH